MNRSMNEQQIEEGGNRTSDDVRVVDLRTVYVSLVSYFGKTYLPTYLLIYLRVLFIGTFIRSPSTLFPHLISRHL